MAARFTVPLLSLMSSGQSYSSPDSRTSPALGIVCHPHICILQQPFWFPSETVPLGCPSPRLCHIPPTPLLPGSVPSRSLQGAPCSEYPPVYAEMAHDSKDIHLPLVLQLLAPDPGGDEAAGAANARAAGQTQLC